MKGALSFLPDDFLALGIALAIGLLIGMERGWKARELEEGQRIAGIRTFGLIALAGGTTALLARELGWPVVAAGLVSTAALMIVAYGLKRQEGEDIGITTNVAALIAFLLGALAVGENRALAASAAVVTTLLLGVKPVLHRWLQRLQPEELYATLKLLLISVVLLPILPDQGFGPWEALNPYRIWLMVVMIAGISFAGYLAMKVSGAEKGIAMTAFFGGLASSTATTLALARMARRDRSMPELLSSGILIACATMYPRILLVAALISLPLAGTLLPPIAVMMILSYAGAYLFWRRARNKPDREPPQLQNPFQIRPALAFGALLTAILLLSRWLEAEWGNTGLYLLGAVSGLADVDAINLSLAERVGTGLSPLVAALAVVIAAASNTIVKSSLALGIGGRALGLRVLAASAVPLAGGAITLLALSD